MYAVERWQIFGKTCCLICQALFIKTVIFIQSATKSCVSSGHTNTHTHTQTQTSSTFAAFMLNNCITSLLDLSLPSDSMLFYFTFTLISYYCIFLNFVLCCFLPYLQFSILPRFILPPYLRCFTCLLCFILFILYIISS